MEVANVPEQLWTPIHLPGCEAGGRVLVTVLDDSQKGFV